MSLIHTVELCDGNPFDYLVALLRQYNVAVVYADHATYPAIASWKALVSSFALCRAASFFSPAQPIPWRRPPPIEPPHLVPVAVRSAELGYGLSVADEPPTTTARVASGWRARASSPSWSGATRSGITTSGPGIR